MATAEAVTTITRPVEDVFAVVTDAGSSAKWASSVIESRQTSDGPVGVGTTFQTVAKFLGRRFETQSVVIEFEPNRTFGWEAKSGPFPLRSTMSLRPVEGGTRIDTRFDAEPGGFFKLAEPLVVAVAKRQFQGDLDNLKDLMEAGAL